MPSLSGVFTTLAGQALSTDEQGSLTIITKGALPKRTAKLRANGEFWLCQDDGNVGKFGDPPKVTFNHKGKAFHLWVEPRDFSEGSYEYGIIPIPVGEEYSGLFLAVDPQIEQLEIIDNWADHAKFRCVE